MADITKEFLDELQNEFNYRYLNSKKINSLTKKLNEGNATAEDAFTFAKEVGNLRKLVLHDLITDDILTDEYLGYYNALEIFTKALYDNYELINNYCKSAFTQVNKRAGINLKGVSVDYDQDKTDGIIECAVKGKYTDTRAETEEAVATNAKCYCDESVRKNAEFQHKSGLSPVIIRTAVGKTCKLCQSLAGTYDYYDVSDTGNDVFRRHSNCDCIVVYSPRKGKYQDVWNKQWMNNREYKNERTKRIEYAEQKEYYSRRIGERGKEVCDQATYNKLTKEFIKRGGQIIRGKEASEHLDRVGAGASYLPSLNVILFRDDATVSEVLEETYHFKQEREHIYENYSLRETLVRREIDAQNYLLECIKRYKISVEEVEEILKNKQYWELELNKLKENR